MYPQTAVGQSLWRRTITQISQIGPDKGHPCVVSACLKKLTEGHAGTPALPPT